ncbi:bifunctional protein-serine/threonine kinase/phosphatase, partial [Methylibium sp. T29-B]|uniref:bifunctional protein-serine/threonine kinase/phosphatase n=1 Tax=Methylibium sp. T29-B TaxID=1437443 RepID=UPI0005692622
HEAGRGLIAAIADGVSAGGHGLVAAQTAVISLVNDFHAVPATWETTVALDRLLGAHNAWLVDHNRRRSGDASGLTTLTAVVLRGHTWTVAHVGDTRAWLLRGGECTQLTHDHAFDHPDLRSQLTRAIGLDDSLRIDFHQGELQIGDTLLLSSDGVHQVLKHAAMRELLGAAETAQQASERLVEAALAAGGRDNATALVVRVRGLDAGSLDDALLLGRQLPIPPRLKVGDTLDGYVITALVANTGVHRLVQARDAATRELVAIKTLHESRAGDPEERAMLAHEAWLGRTVTERDGQGFVRVREPRDPSAFYAVFDWHGGRTLEQLLEAGQAFSVEEIVQGTLAAARALGRLHRQRVVHRDVKPANLHLGDDGQWRLLDLGVAISGREPPAVRSLHAGTPSYMNPEQWEAGHAGADAASDLYALGVTLYRWLSGRLPYGEIEPFQIARYRRDPIAPSRLRPELPIWLDHVVLKAVARERQQRFETAEEFVLALERGASRPLAAPPATPLVARDPNALWKIAFAISLLFNVLLVVWLLFLPR